MMNLLLGVLFISVASILGDNPEQPTLEVKSCPANQAPVQNRMPVESNGCSKPAFLVVQDEEDFTYCCDRHDACYQIVNLQRGFCDQDFLKCMRKMCHEVYSHNPKCSNAADMYMFGTSAFGEAAFVNTQNQHMDCVDNDQVIPHYVNLVDEFYRTNTPVTKDISAIQEKVEKYATNAGTSTHPSYPKLGSYLYALYNKYDNAIVHIEGRINRDVPKLEL
jgi:Group XII secretory phospholipase A2 precursor (PLA2G12)